jgi:hypothetical protein
VEVTEGMAEALEVTEVEVMVEAMAVAMAVAMAEAMEDAKEVAGADKYSSNLNLKSQRTYFKLIMHLKQ